MDESQRIPAPWGWALMLMVALGFSACASQTPRSDRDWTPYLARTAAVTADDAGLTIAPVSDWRYGPEGATAQIYGSTRIRTQDLRRVWFALEPQPGSEAAAHTFLLFEFEGGRLLGLTVEARREADEAYDAIAGAFNRYELSYVWATARDLLTGRAVHLQHDLYVYPVDITPAQRDALLSETLARTGELATRPRFYNTLFSNCTNELAKAAGLDWTYQWILTGYSDEYLYGEGLIPAPSLTTAKSAARIERWVAANNGITDAAAFDAALLAELRRRWR